MSTTAVGPTPEQIEMLKAEVAKRRGQIGAALRHPAGLLQHTQCIDAKTGERFAFELEDPQEGWYWQRGVLDKWIEHPLSLVLKARQIGITWLGTGYALWKLLALPGTRALIVSINEDEAVKVVNRLFDMYQSLPDHLRFGSQITKPARGARPSTLMELTFPDGRISSVIGLPSTRRAGHGETATIVLLDEFARHEYARESWKSTFPTADNGGQIIVISTANGISNEQTGEGNFYHHLYVNAEDYGIDVQFLPWSLHPDRDEGWYERNARALPPVDRAEQFPRSPDDAFINTGQCWFDLEALGWYALEHTAEPLYRARFFSNETGSRAKLHKTEQGWIRVYQQPNPEHDYAIGADVATGRGLDYSCAYVIDLATQAIAAEFHGKLDADEFSEQLHYLGRWYGTARLAVEMGGGYGEPVVIALRDGRRGRPHYPKLYRHTIQDRPDMRLMANYGYPINNKTRPLIINGLEQAIREKTLPGMPRELLMECRTFIRRDQLPSPAAADGCNDDRVMACGLALEMYRLYGHHTKRVTPPRRKAKTHRYPWQTRGAA